MQKITPINDFHFFLLKILKKIGVIFLLFLAFIILYIFRDLYSEFGINKEYRLKYIFHSPAEFSLKRLEHGEKKFNTFIFGSSRSIPLYACYIKHKIFNNDAKIKPFHFVNYCETLNGIYNKIVYLDKKNIRIKNAFILFDHTYTFTNKDENINNDYYLYNKISPWYQIKSHFLSFFYYSGKDLPKNLRILSGLTNYRDYKFSDTNTNDLFHNCSEIIKENKYDTLFFNNSSPVNNEENDLFERKNKKYTLNQQLSLSEIYKLNKIKSILKKHKSKYVVLFAPMYDQCKLNHHDQASINSIFGKQNIIDFSGKNKITENKKFYSSTAHYYPIVGKIMIDSIVKTQIFK